MAVTIAALQAVGSRPVTLVSGDGTFVGSIVTERLSESSIMIEFTVDGDPGYPIVIPVDDIRDVVER
jgi:hypothetical protein